MATAVKFRFAQVPRQQGELARIRVLAGPDTGSVYVVTGHQVSIGRGDENDVVLNDLKSSRRHAQISWVNGAWEVVDFGSANGILHNGKPTPKSALRTKDTITLGGTTLEFLGSEAGTGLLTGPAPSALQIQAQQLSLSQRQQSIRGAGGGGPIADSNRKPKMLALFGVLALLLVFMLPEEKKPASATKKPDASRDLAAFLPPGAASQSPNPAADAFFKMGFREYRERNFLRARTQFETVLQLEPGHRLARMYMDNCRLAIDQEIQFHLARGKKDTDSGKVKQAKGHFEAILRLLHRDTANPAYIEARDNLKKLNEDERSAS